MYPPEVGLRAEDSILEQLASQARETLAQLKTDGVVGDDVVLQVATGNGWDEALEAADWQDGDLLAMGTSPAGGIAACSWVARLKDPAAQPRPGPGATRLVLRGAAVDGDLTARDRRRPVTGQPGNHVGNLFGQHEFLRPFLP